MKFYRKLKHIWRCWKKTRITSTTARELRLYPEVPQKPLKQIRKELYWLCRYRRRRSNTMDDTILDYFNMGIDRAGEDLKKYVFRVEVDIARSEKLNLVSGVLQDKMITSTLLQLNGVATSGPILYKSDFVSNEEAIEKLKQSGKTKFFAKKLAGSLGKGTFPFTLKDGEFEIKGQKISEQDLAAKLDGYIVDPLIEQHEAMNRLYPHAVSSVRLVTVCANKKIEIIISNLFVGGDGSHTAYLYVGGLLLGIDKSGYLSEYGLRTKVNRGLHKSHPDTGVVFKDFKIPYWEEACDLVIRAHMSFPQIHSIGWDVAITKDGPGREKIKKYFNIS